MAGQDDRAGGKPVIKAAVALMMALQAGFCAYAAVSFMDETAASNDPIMAFSLASLALLFSAATVLMTSQVVSGLRTTIAARRLAVPAVTESEPPV